VISSTTVNLYLTYMNAKVSKECKISENEFGKRNPVVSVSTVSSVQLGDQELATARNA
jgi:hypothetical protein